MTLIESPSTDPAFNLALEEHVFENLPKNGEYFMLWRNRSAVIVGRNQNAYAEISADFIREQGITVVRRLSGGGAVYHDLGNLNFTFVVDAENTEKTENAEELDFKLFCEPVAAVLRSLGVDARTSGRNDITIAGKKFSGNAQYIKKGRVMHHGTIMFDSDLDAVDRALNADYKKLDSKGVKSVRSRVTNVREHLPADMSLDEFKRLIIGGVFHSEAPARYELTPDDAAEAERLRGERYSRWEWNYGSSPAHSIRRSKRFDGVGGVETAMDAENGVIRTLDIYGDFFGIDDPKELAAKLVNLPLTYEALSGALSALPVGRYIKGLTAAQLISILL